MTIITDNAPQTVDSFAKMGARCLISKFK